MAFIANEPYLWAVVFSNGDGSKQAWDVFTREGFRHCWCFRKHGSGIMAYEYLAYRHDVRIQHHYFDTYCQMQRLYGNKLLFIRHVPDVNMVYRPFYTCVEAVKAHIGIHSPLVLTPKSLYNRLLKLGATKHLGAW